MTTAIQTRYHVEGMDCASCAAKIDTALRRLSGIEDVSVTVTGRSLSVTHADEVSPREIMRQVSRLGYAIALAAGESEQTQDSGANSQLHGYEKSEIPWWRTSRAALTITCGIALVLAYAAGLLFPKAGHWPFVAALLVGLVPIGRRAVVAATTGTPFSIETLMTVAAVGAVIIGATEEAATVVLLFLVGEMLEGVAASRARASIQGLSALVPKSALLEQDGGGPVEVPADTLAVGSVILVRPGDRVPADGEIIEGASEIDEAPVTGESTPKRKTAGDPVFAGTISTDGVLRIRVTAAAADNTIARVIRLVEEAQESKAPTERFIDRFSRYYTPGVVAVAALVAILPPLLAGAEWGTWVYRGLAILLIGCPCALVISTPAAVAAGLATGARRGLLIKGGAVLEGFGKITAVAFDKTGTLTEGKPVVTDVIGFGRSGREILSLAAALEQGSSHPLAKAILDRARADKAPVPPAMDAKALPGKGVAGSVGGRDVFLGSPAAAAERTSLSPDQTEAIESLNAEGKTVSVLLTEAGVAGLVALRDEPREGARRGIEWLRNEGIRTLMLTGDNRRTAEAIAESLGLEARAELLPEDKQNIVRQLQREGFAVAKVGDGINDAPGLAAADIGVAMGGGTDVALETADAATLHGRVTDVANMVMLSRATMGNIRQNIAVALGLKALFLFTTVFGITGLWPAILADTGATVLVTANAMRLLRWKPSRR